MAGKKCPICKKLTFVMNGRSGECNTCGYTMRVPANVGKGGKGKKCLNCGRFTVFNDSCDNCGARYSYK